MRAPIARHGRFKKRSAAMTVLKYAALSLTVLLVAVVAVGSYVTWDSFKRYTDNAVELPSSTSPTSSPKPPTMAFEAYPGEVNFLLAGTDECEPEFSYIFGDRCTEQEGARNDVTLLVHVPADHQSATVISFPRDLMTSFPECTTEAGDVTEASSYKQLNTAYDTGGLPCVVKTVEELSGFSIPFAAKISWGGVINITDKLGGVDVCVANGIHDSYAGLSLDPGTHTLKGADALAFLRTRHGLSDGSDLARISNQQLYMASMLKKLTGEGTLNNPMAMLGIAQTVVDNVQHSTSLNSPGTLVSLALLLKDLPLERITFAQLPTMPDPDDANRVVAEPVATEALWTALHSQLPVTVEANEAGAVVEAPPASSEAPTAPPAAPPGALAPGMTAAEASCANGAG